MKSVVMSSSYPELCGALEAEGFTVIPTDKAEALPSPEQQHADLQLLVISDRLFLLKESTTLKNKLWEYDPLICSQPIGNTYPDNIALNMLLLDNRIYGRTDHIEPLLKDYCREKGIELVFMKQGYARCTTLALNDEAVITADKGVRDKLIDHGAEVLLINGDGIRLDGYDRGFIGGATMVCGNMVYFFGNAARLAEYAEINSFCEKYGFLTKIICPEIPLTDIGGAVVLPNPSSYEPRTEGWNRRRF